MNYVEIVNLVFTCIFGLYGLLMLHFVIFGIIGVFTYKKSPKTDVIN
jgi:type IV secretory pathway VirB2 component (pilin)